ncbi:MAG: hypothetical protein ACRDNS_34155 [Trebonia sp.]
MALTQIIDPAHSTDRVTPAHGTRLVGAVFTIKGISQALALSLPSSGT